MMRQKSPDGEVHAQVATETVHESVDDLRKSLTVIYAYAQILQRQSGRGTQLPPAEVEKRAQVIASAARHMVEDLNKLEDACEE